MSVGESIFGGPASPRPSFCGGALIRVTGEELSNFKRDGVVFCRIDKTGNGYNDARVRCSENIEIERIEDHPEDPRGEIIVRHVRLGICRSCRHIEEYVARLRKESKP